MKTSEMLSSLEVRWFMSSMATGALGILWTKCPFSSATVDEHGWCSPRSFAFLLFILAGIGYGFRITFFWENVKTIFSLRQLSNFCWHLYFSWSSQHRCFHCSCSPGHSWTFCWNVSCRNALCNWLFSWGFFLDQHLLSNHCFS